MEYSKKASNCKLLLLDGYYTRAFFKYALKQKMMFTNKGAKSAPLFGRLEMLFRNERAVYCQEVQNGKNT